MEMKTKKIAFLGDSITEGVGVSSQDKLYWNLVAQKTDAKCYANCISGSRIAPQRVPTSFEPRADRYFGSRVEELIPDADIVVIFGGTNDFGHGDAALGDMNDRSEDTFYGSYHLLLQRLIERYPAGQIVVMTPLHRSLEDSLYNGYGVRRVGSLTTYVNAIRQVAEHYGVPVVDLFKDCKIQPQVEVLKERYAPDGLHPNDAGHELICQCLLNVLERL